MDIEKILVANRGEIAVRVMRTAARMGIRTVAVYSDADRDAVHVRAADEAVHIGASAAAESYLKIDAIIAAARQTGADAVHPGYGFLSENPDFVRACQAAGLIFIGPSAEAMEAMGLKDAAKALMDAADVPTTPGYLGADQDADVLAAEAARIGYPVLIKAVAGGGGKGMRRVETADGFADALTSAKREARASFGNDRVLIEKFITAPRHIEVQVFGDRHGHVVHMYERDCSLQRRHQKVIEEAPAPGMSAEVRAAMTAAAVRAAKAVDYVGAGTVEFIVDGSGPLRVDGFWFMEMNTRLQVEHPVTEAVTGLDLVEWQIRVARGEALPAQDDIALKGHAVEARLYAENPATDFLPDTGRLDVLDLPRGGRVDSGVARGGEVSIHYDPMIAKLIAWGRDRTAVVDKLTSMCRRVRVWPVKTNARFLVDCLSHAKFRDGDVSTGFIAAEIETAPAPDLDRIAASVMRAPRRASAFDAGDGFRINGPARRTATRYVDGEAMELEMRSDARPGILRETAEGSVVFADGAAYLVQDVLPGGAAASSGNAVAAPMPGKVIAVNVAVGDSVAKGQSLIVLEAMKMEMPLEAPRDGIVAEMAASVGGLVKGGDVLAALEDIEEG